jgi:hypothetical protein
MAELGESGVDVELNGVREATVAAILRCYEARGYGDIQDRRMRREFDPTWKAMRDQVQRYTVALRERGLAIDAVIDMMKAAVVEAVPSLSLAPHNAIRSSVVGWCVAVYHKRG